METGKHWTFPRYMELDHQNDYLFSDNSPGGLAMVSRLLSVLQLYLPSSCLRHVAEFFFTTNRSSWVVNNGKAYDSKSRVTLLLSSHCWVGPPCLSVSHEETGGAQNLYVKKDHLNMPNPPNWRSYTSFNACIHSTCGQLGHWRNVLCIACIASITSNSIASIVLLL